MRKTLDKHLLFAGFLAVAAFILLHLLSYQGLVADLYVIDDKALLHAPHLQQKLSPEAILDVFRFGIHIDYYPIRDLTYLIFNATEARVFNLRIFHRLLLLGSCILFYYILLQLKVHRHSALAASLICLVHPMFNIQVFWVSATKDNMATFFILLSAFFFFRSLHSDRHTHSSPALMVLFFVCSLLSKATYALTVFPAIFYIWQNRSTRFGQLPYYLAFATILSVLYSLLQTYFYKELVGMAFPYDFSYRLGSATAALGKALAGAFWYSHNVIENENWGLWLSQNSSYMAPGILLFLAFFVILLFSLHKNRVQNFNLCLLSLAIYIPVSGLIFPHRNLYSVPYFTPFIFLLAFVSGKKLDSAGIKRSHINLCLSFLFVFFMSQQFFDIDNYKSATAVWRKALRNSSQSISSRHNYLLQLISERLKSQGGEQKTAETNRDIQSVFNKLRQDCFADPLPKEKGLSCLSFYRTTYYLFQNQTQKSEAALNRYRETVLFNNLPKKNLFQIDLTDAVFRKKIPPSVLNNFLNSRRQFITPEERLIYWAAICVIGNTRLANEVISESLSAHLVDLKRIHTFARENSIDTEPCLQSYH